MKNSFEVARIEAKQRNIPLKVFVGELRDLRFVERSHLGVVFAHYRKHAIVLQSVMNVIVVVE